MNRFSRSTIALWILQMPLLYFFLCSLVASALLVAVSIPTRWNGGGGITEWHVPLRPLTPEEAVFLLKKNSASILSMNATHVTIGSQYFVISYQQPALANGHPTMQMEAAPATYDDYYSVYTLSRAPLEASLGRRLTIRDIHSEAFSHYQVSFSPDYLPFYFLFETGFLALLITFIFWWVRRVRSRWQIIHSFTIAQLALLIVVPFYAPAFADADWFFQRIILESLWIWSALTFVFTLIASVICIVGHMLSIMWKSRTTSPKKQKPSS